MAGTWLAWLVSLTAVLAGPLPTTGRTTYNFNPGWRVFVGDPSGAEAPGFDDSAWKRVTLPYAWNEDSAFKVSVQTLPTGIAWYRKRFVLPPGSIGKKAFLEFEGIRQAGDFTLNGQAVGRSENGVMAFGFDITDALKPYPQENVLAARIDNSYSYKEKATGSSFEWNDRNFYANYGGINKNVFLHITDRLYQTLPLYSDLGTTGVYVYAQNFDIPRHTALVTMESQVKNDYPTAKTFGYQAVVQDRTGQVVKTINGGSYTLLPGRTMTVRAAAQIRGLHFWSWGYGYLYTVSTILTVNGSPIDVVKTRTGFRKTAFDHGMVRLNDRVIQIHGYGQRTTNEWPAIGLSVPAWVSDFSNRMIVQGNGNLVRWMHVTPWKQDIESFDRLGLMMSMPAGDSERDVTDRRWQQRLELMRDAMIYNRNDPSILFYEAGNNQVSEDHMRQIKALRDTWDPHGGRAAGSRNMQGSQVAEYGGEMLYINKSAAKPMWAMEYSRDEALRKWWDADTPPYHSVPVTQVYVKPAPGRPEPVSYEYNRNQDTQAMENVARWYDYWHERPGTGTRVNAGGVKIIFSDSNTHFRGTQNYRRSGEVDAERLPKDSYYADQVMWDGWVDVTHPRAYIIGHWNYAPGITKDISVVSSADRVRLFVNGVPLGWGRQSDRFLFTFRNVAWRPGVLKAVGYAADGKVLCVTQKVTAGPPVALRLTPHTGPGGLKADGADLALIDVEVVDSQGRRCPTALNTVHFALTGPAEWRGGIAQDDDRPDNYILSQDLPVQCGVNRVIIRAAPSAGAITLTAASPGLKSASVALASHAMPVIGGLSQDMPGDGLPPYLDRGPTPPGPSFAPTRLPVPIAGATAGANADKCSLSYDDDEVTAWSNDGRLSTAWIQYRYARPAAVTQVTLKMGGWRQRSYPIRITVDGRLVFAGTTPRSLGYVTLPIKPVLGRTLKIVLAGLARDQNAVTSSPAVPATPAAPTTGQAAVGAGVADTSAVDPNARGMLDIVEVELYENLKKP